MVFENAGTGFNNIQGQRLHKTNFDIVREGDVFDPGSSVEVELNPDVTWSKTRGEYLVTWQCWLEYYIRDHYQIVFSLIYESEQGPGVSEIFSGPYWLFSTGLGYDYDQANPAVAYNNLSGHYLITFTMEGPDYKELVGVLLAGASLI